VVGIEAQGFDHGAPLSAAVLAAIPPATDAALGIIEEAAARIRHGVGG
jgi:hypothetical protein